MDLPLNSQEEKRKTMLINKRVRQLQRKLNSKGIEYDIQVSVIF